MTKSNKIKRKQETKDLKNLMDTELRQIRVLSREKDEIEELGSVNRAEEGKDGVIFSPGSCLHTRKFACVLIPCALPLFYLAGELLFGVSVLCLMGMYLIEHTSKSRKSTIVTFVLSVLALQLTTIYCLLPYIWKSLFNIGLVFIYNVFLVLSGGVGLLHIKQLQYEEPDFVVYLEYILFVSYPIAGQFVLTSVSALFLGWWSAPFFCILYGFLFIQVFIPPSRPSFLHHEAFHKPGEERISERFILGPMEKTLFFFNMLSVPGSMFIIIYLLEFLHLVTWAKLLLCGLVPLFLCTCLDSKEVMDFLEFSNKGVSQVRWLSGLSSLFLFTVIVWSSGAVSIKVLPLLVGSVLLGLVIGVTARSPETKVHHQASSVLLVLLYIFLLWSMVFNISNLFITPSFHTLSLLMVMTSLSVLSVMAVVMSNSVKKQGLNVVLLLQSIGMVLCEHLLVDQHLYSVHYALLTGLITIYVTSRLYMVGMADWHVAWLCSSIHCSKLSMCVTILVPQSTLEQGFLLPSFLQTNSTLLSLLFNLIISRLLFFYNDDETVSLLEGVKICFGIGAATLLVYDSVVLPLWLVLTNQWPSTADAAATLLLLWGVLCLKVSLVQLSHNLDAKRLNIVILCGGVLVEFVQPDFNPIKVCWSFVVYFISLIWPLHGSWRALLAEDLCLPWLVMISIVTALVVLVKLIRIDQCSTLGRGVVSFLVGCPIGLKAASLVLPPDRPPFLCLSYGLSLSLVVFLIITSWTHLVTSDRAYRGYSYMGVIVCFLMSLFLESSIDRKSNPNTSKTVAVYSGSIVSYPCLVCHLVLHLILAVSLKKESAKSRESLEDNKGKLPPASVLLSSSFLANISVILSCALGLMCTPSQYWELWVSLCTCVFFLWRPEGFTLYDGRRIDITPVLPAYIFLCLSLYTGTIITAFPTGSGILSILGFCVNVIFLHCAIPTYYGLARALWKKEIPLPLQQLVVFCAPANVVLLIYCSTIAGRVLGLLGIVSAYWVFYYVECSDFRNTSK